MEHLSYHDVRPPNGGILCHTRPIHVVECGKDPQEALGRVGKLELCSCNGQGLLDLKSILLRPYCFGECSWTNQDK
jgi:hypothetical protein